jgi:hypothetical protein
MMMMIVTIIDFDLAGLYSTKCKEPIEARYSSVSRAPSDRSQWGGHCFLAPS